MLYETNIGWILIDKNVIILKVDKKNIFKIIINIKNLKINLKKKEITIKNIEKFDIVFKCKLENLENIDCKIKDIFYVEDDIILWIFKLYVKINLYQKFNTSFIDIPFIEWENKEKKFKINKSEFRIIKNIIEIDYKLEDVFLVYKYINELKWFSKYLGENIIIKFEDNELDWDIQKKPLEIVNIIIKNNKCKIINEENFTHLIIIE
jgi:hypothetical protein